MFSKYKKNNVAPRDATEPAINAQPTPAPVVAHDKGKKRRERFAEIKLEVHRALLENLNLSALEHASEQDLRSEIAAICGEYLEEQNIALNQDDRATINTELYLSLIHI